MLGHARSGLRRRDVPGLEPLGLRVLRRRRRLERRAHAAARLDRRRATWIAPWPRCTWAAEHDFVGLCLGNSPIYGPKEWGNLEYNDPSFEPLWSLVEETGLPLTFHVSTGRDPRAVGGNGGAIINYVCHSMETTIEPLVQLITSGVFERHPALQAGLVESGIGFVPWLLETMDYAYKAHHFWVRPGDPRAAVDVLPAALLRHVPGGPRRHRGGGAHDLVDNLMWANDYPHHEGSWPHSAASIERQMAASPTSPGPRSSGCNAVRVFRL